MIFDVKYFIQKFESIPEEEWCAGSFSKKVGKQVQKCALGHCGEGEVFNTAEARALICLLKKPSAINDGLCGGELTPKQRILAALREKS